MKEERRLLWLAVCKERGGGGEEEGKGVNNKNKICLKSAVMKSNSSY